MPDIHMPLLMNVLLFCKQILVLTNFVIQTVFLILKKMEIRPFNTSISSIMALWIKT